MVLDLVLWSWVWFLGFHGRLGWFVSCFIFKVHLPLLPSAHLPALAPASHLFLIGDLYSSMYSSLIFPFLVCWLACCFPCLLPLLLYPFVFLPYRLSVRLWIPAVRCYSVFFAGNKKLFVGFSCLCASTFGGPALNRDTNSEVGWPHS